MSKTHKQVQRNTWREDNHYEFLAHSMLKAGGVKMMLRSRKLEWKWMTCSFRGKPHPSRLIYGPPLFRQLPTNLTLQPGHHTEYRLARTEISHTDCLAKFFGEIFFQIFSIHCITVFLGRFFQNFITDCLAVFLGDFSRSFPQIASLWIFGRFFPWSFPQIAPPY